MVRLWKTWNATENSVNEMGTIEIRWKVSFGPLFILFLSLCSKYSSSEKKKKSCRIHRGDNEQVIWPTKCKQKIRIEANYCYTICSVNKHCLSFYLCFTHQLNYSKLIFITFHSINYVFHIAQCHCLSYSYHKKKK